MTHTEQPPKLKLYAPKSYWEASEDELKKITNGCGTDGWKGALVPETLWGLSVSTACNIHDWMYQKGQSFESKEEADRVFLNNMVRTVNYNTNNCILKKLRRHRAKVYFEVVSLFGGDAFWNGKNPVDTFKDIEERTI